LRDEGIAPWLAAARHPRHLALEEAKRIRVGEDRRERVAEVMRMVGGHVYVASQLFP
jgi:hypothetical protein